MWDTLYELDQWRNELCVNLGAVAQVMYLGFSAPPGKDVAEEWRWEVENTHETEVGKETTEPSISANGKYLS